MKRNYKPAKQGSETNRTSNSTDNFIEIDVCVRKYFLQQINCKKSEIAWYGTPVNITVNKSTFQSKRL